MEGLIKGLTEVVLGIVVGDREDHHDSQSPKGVEERSRSTWAEVVSTGTHDGQEQQQGSKIYSYSSNQRRSEKNDESGKESSLGHNSSSWSSRKKEEDLACECSEKTHGDWEVVGQGSHKKKRHPLATPKAPKVNWQRFKLPPSDQEYTAAYYGTETQPSRIELSDLSEACSKLWQLDLNRLVPGKDYEINCGEGKKVYQKADMASGSLFTWLDDDVFNRPTYARFCSLLDNYNPQEGFKEVVTPEERHEQAAFIQEISRTPPIKYLHNYLFDKGIVSDSYEEFKEMLIHLWFDLYSRGGGSGSSSAFEHVFVGEVKGRGEYSISGFHNWIQFYLEEAKGNVDYQGYIFPRGYEHPDSETQLLTIQFEWNGVLKSVSSTLLGVSPELEVALYTLCFFVGGEDNHIRLGPYPVNIKYYRLGHDKIGSVFPIAE